MRKWSIVVNESLLSCWRGAESLSNAYRRK
jgi:hypothetical protein